MNIEMFSLTEPDQEIIKSRNTADLWQQPFLPFAVTELMEALLTFVETSLGLAITGKGHQPWNVPLKAPVFRFLKVLSPI